MNKPTKPETPTFLLHLNNNSCLFIWLALIYGSFIIESRCRKTAAFFIEKIENGGTMYENKP